MNGKIGCRSGKGRNKGVSREKVWVNGWEGRRGKKG